MSAVEVEGGFSNRVVRLDTVRGRFAVKVFDRSLDANRDEAALERATEIELAAWSAGLRVPIPVLDDHREVLVEVDDSLVRVHEWVIGWSPDSGPADVELAAQVGEWLARLHRLGLPTGAAGLDGLDEVSDTGVWSELVDVVGDRDFGPALRTALDPITRAVELVQDADRDGSVIGTHRDLFPRNALVTSAGLSVCDWDVAGGWLATEEIAAAAVDWSGGILGPVDTP
ncbi:MAG: phosphotransferase, partial [Actinomycetota bacterium]